MLFGNIADRLGRKKATVWAMLGSAIGTALIVALPGFNSIGITAVFLLVAMRFITGIFLGGQYTGAVPLAMESAPPAKRGLYGGLISMGFPIAFCVVSLITYVVLAVTAVPGAATNSAYIEWGWRIPFAIGAIFTFVFAIFYHRTVQESPAFRKRTADAPSPLRQLFKGRHAASTWNWPPASPLAGGK